MSVRLKLYALGIPLAILSGALVVATVLPYRVTQERLSGARDEITAVVATQAVERKTVETMWNTLRFILTEDNEAPRAIERLQRESAEALETWSEREPSPAMARKIDLIARLMRYIDRETANVIEAIHDGDRAAAIEIFYEVVYPAFDDQLDDEIDEVIRRNSAQLREGFISLASAAGRVESLFGGRLTGLLTETSTDVAQAQIGSDFISDLTDAAVEMVEPVLDGSTDFDDAREGQADTKRVLDSWGRALGSSQQSARARADLQEVSALFEALGRTEERIINESSGDASRALAIVAETYADQLQSLIASTHDLIADEEAAIAASTSLITRDARRMNVLMSVGSVSVLVIGGLFVVVIATKLSRRIRGLTFAALKIGKGELTARVDIDTPDELGDLAETFNAMAQNLAEAKQRSASLFGRTVEATEQERTELAADLHDGPVQRLTALGYRLERATASLKEGDSANTEAILENVKTQVSVEIRGLRRMMVELRPPALDERGLVAAVSDYAQDFGLQNEIAVTTSVANARRLPAAVETTIYRVMQEALTNIAKHAGASNVSVTISDDGRVVALTVEDDGRGFDVSSVRPSGGQQFGLDGMEQRINIAGGQWRIDSIPGRGTKLSAQLPVEDEESDVRDRSRARFESAEKLSRLS